VKTPVDRSRGGKFEVPNLSEIALSMFHIDVSFVDCYIFLPKYTLTFSIQRTVFTNYKFSQATIWLHTQFADNRFNCADGHSIGGEGTPLRYDPVQKKKV
jgi:hypothetical protein